MAGIRLEFAQFGDFDSFDILRSSSPMDIAALPSPIGTGLATMYYVDTAVVEGATYYYRARVWRDGAARVSDEVKVKVGVIGDKHWDKVISLVSFDGDFTDKKGNTWTANNADATFSTEQAKFGTGSLRAINSGRLQATIPVIGTDDFTIEFQIYPLLVSGAWQRYFSIGSYANAGSIYILNVSSSNPPRVLVGMNSNNNLSSQGSETALNMLAWNHVAVTREANMVRIFINGALKASNNWPIFYIDETGAQINDDIGRSNPFNAHYDELRITKGIARYTANFTPPDAPFPSS